MAAALAEADSGRDPMGVKSKLARRIVSLYHDAAAAARAADHFDRVVRRKDAPAEIDELEIAPWGERLGLGRLLKEAGLVPSTSEARRLVEAGAVTVDGAKVTDPQEEIPAEPGRAYLLKVGKRNYLRVRIGVGGGSSSGKVLP